MGETGTEEIIQRQEVLEYRYYVASKRLLKVQMMEYIDVMLSIQGDIIDVLQGQSNLLAQLWTMETNDTLRRVRRAVIEIHWEVCGDRCRGHGALTRDLRENTDLLRALQEELHDRYIELLGLSPAGSLVQFRGMSARMYGNILNRVAENNLHLRGHVEKAYNQSNRIWAARTLLALSAVDKNGAAVMRGIMLQGRVQRVGLDPVVKVDCVAMLREVFLMSFEHFGKEATRVNFVKKLQEEYRGFSLCSRQERKLFFTVYGNPKDLETVLNKLKERSKIKSKFFSRVWKSASDRVLNGDTYTDAENFQRAHC